MIYFSPNTLIDRFGALISDKDARGPIWHDTLHLIAAFPIFGCGLGNYATAFLKYQTTHLQVAYDYAHNDFLQLASELGFLGFAIFSGLIISISYTTIRFANNAPDRCHRYLRLACIGGLSAIGIHSLADFNLYIPANAFVLAWISGIATTPPLQSKSHAARLVYRITLVAGILLSIYALGWLMFSSFFRSDIAAERLFCHFGICDTDSVLAIKTLNHAGTAPQSALKYSLARDPGSPLRWCDLGDSYLRSKQSAEAEYCFSRAIALAPHIPPVLIRVANFYHLSGESRRALEMCAQLLASTDEENSIVFDRFNTNQIAVKDVLDNGMPNGSRAPQEYLRYLIGFGNIDNAAIAWDWLLSQSKTDEQITLDYTNFLFGQQEYERAAEAWADHLDSQRNGYLQTEWVYNGGFERDLGPSRLDWDIQKLPDVEVSHDTRIVHSGRYSMCIRFNGRENLTYSHISQTVFVRPGDYTFLAYIRCENITSDQGVGFHIVDPETPIRVDTSTKPLTGSLDWTRVEQPISVPPGTRILEIQIVRQPTWRLFDNATTGAFWIDDVKLLQLQ